MVNYSVVAGLSALGGALFWFCFRKLDSEEFELNALKAGQVHTGVKNGEESA